MRKFLEPLFSIYLKENSVKGVNHITSSGLGFQTSTPGEKIGVASLEKSEECFRKAIAEPLSQAGKRGEVGMA